MLLHHFDLIIGEKMLEKENNFFARTIIAFFKTYGDKEIPFQKFIEEFLKYPEDNKFQSRLNQFNSMYTEKAGQYWLTQFFTGNPDSYWGGKHTYRWTEKSTENIKLTKPAIELMCKKLGLDLNNFDENLKHETKEQEYESPSVNFNNITEQRMKMQKEDMELDF